MKPGRNPDFERSRRRRQIWLAQARHFDASRALASLQKGHVFVSAAASSLMNIFEICQTTNAITRKAMIELMNAPQRIATSVAGSPPVAAFSTIFSSLKSTPPRRTPTGGMMMSLTSELTTVPRAVPMMTPIASARALVLSRNSRNCLTMRVSFDLGVGARASVTDDLGEAVRLLDPAGDRL